MKETGDVLGSSTLYSAADCTCSQAVCIQYALGLLLLSGCGLSNRSAKGHRAKTRHGTNMLTLVWWVQAAKPD